MDANVSAKIRAIRVIRVLFRNGRLVIARWDNVPHHYEIVTFPHHMHENKGVSACSNMDLKAAIEIIMDKTMN